MSLGVLSVTVPGKMRLAAAAGLAGERRRASGPVAVDANIDVGHINLASRAPDREECYRERHASSAVGRAARRVAAGLT